VRRLVDRIAKTSLEVELYCRKSIVFTCWLCKRHHRRRLLLLRPPPPPHPPPPPPPGGGVGGGGEGSAALSSRLTCLSPFFHARARTPRTLHVPPYARRLLRYRKGGQAGLHQSYDEDQSLPKQHRAVRRGQRCQYVAHRRVGINRHHTASHSCLATTLQQHSRLTVKLFKPHSTTTITSYTHAHACTHMHAHAHTRVRTRSSVACGSTTLRSITFFMFIHTAR
jgi:hypothetical protein